MQPATSPTPRPALAPTRDPLPPALVTALRQTRPWITFFAVIGLVVALLTALGGVRELLKATSFGERARSVGTLVFSVIYYLPSMYLFRYRDAIQKILAGGGMATLTAAIVHQKSFWRASGVLAILTLIFGVVILLIALVAMAVLAARASG